VISGAEKRFATIYSMSVADHVIFTVFEKTVQ
jgi:hypothetical protein